MNPEKKNIIERCNCIENKRNYAIMIVLMVSFLVSCSFAQEQNQINSERKQLFDDNWKFFLGDTTAANAKDFNDNNWRILDLPHDWSIEGEIDPENPMGTAGGYFPSGDR